MIYSYKIDEICQYIPVHLNVVFNSKELYYFKDIVTPKIAQEIYEEIKERKKTYIVMDFDRIGSFDSRIFKDYIALLEEGYKFLFVNLNLSCMSLLYDDELPGYVEKKDEMINCLFSKELHIPDNKKYLDYCKQENIDKFTKTFIANYLYENRDPKKQQLESTNVEANMYIDVKNIFIKTYMYIYIIYSLCSLIKDNYDLKNIDYLISSSNNGAILSVLIGQLLNKKAVNFVNLGPHLSLYNKDVINELEKEKNYLLIYDFICMGTEFKLAKTIIELKDASLIGAIGIANYLKPNLKLDVYQIFNINDKNIKDFQYSIKVGENLC